MNYKRKRPRTSSTCGKMERRRIDDLKRRGCFFWMNSYPAWWDTVFHRRPERRAQARTAHAVLVGSLDADDVAWPVSHRPHRYYW